jgi:hypothetical protein
VKQIIRKILKEDATDRYISYVLSDIKKRRIFQSDKAIKLYGIDDRLLNILEDTAVAKLHDLKGETINTDDVYGGKWGTYSFKFNVYSVLDWRRSGNESNIGIDIEFDNEGYLEVDGEDYTIKEGIFHDDWGWEVEYEVNDVIKSVLIEIIPELLFIEHLDVNEKYFYEG